jgi:hypothetical protein
MFLPPKLPHSADNRSHLILVDHMFLPPSPPHSADNGSHLILVDHMFLPPSPPHSADNGSHLLYDSLVSRTAYWVDVFELSARNTSVTGTKGRLVRDPLPPKLLYSADDGSHLLHCSLVSRTAYWVDVFELSARNTAVTGTKGRPIRDLLCSNRTDSVYNDSPNRTSSLVAIVFAWPDSLLSPTSVGLAAAYVSRSVCTATIQVRRTRLPERQLREFHPMFPTDWA